MARPFYETVYHCKDWKLSDAFRPTPGWGMRRFTCPVSALPSSLTEDELVQLTKEAAPEGYRLTSLTICPEGGPDRVIWSTAPDPRFATQAAPAAASTKESA